MCGGSQHAESRCVLNQQKRDIVKPEHIGTRSTHLTLRCARSDMDERRTVLRRLAVLWLACNGCGATTHGTTDRSKDAGARSDASVTTAANGRKPGVQGDGPPACGTPTEQLDLLFMIDNSSSMASKQASLRAQFASMIRALTSGGTSAIDGTRRVAVRDLHVGVVSSDMGIPNVEYGACHADGGDDGRLQHSGRAVPGLTCDATYPDFLSYSATANTDTAKLSDDLGCIATLGTSGCDFEEQLEAPLKALWPSVYLDASGQPSTPNPITFLATTPDRALGRGDVPAAQGGNLGFLRKGSAIAIVVVTDKDDCSVKSTEHLIPSDLLPDDSIYKREVDMHLRCFNHPEFMYDLLQRYYKGFRALRAGHESLVTFSAIAGVPTDLVNLDSLRAVDFTNDNARNAFYYKVLMDSRMGRNIDPVTKPGSGNGNLLPSCSYTVAGESARSTAYPPVRLVQLAEYFRQNGMVQSICQDDLSDAIETIVDGIAKGLANTCP
jgi:hypothetical protein